MKPARPFEVMLRAGEMLEVILILAISLAAREDAARAVDVAVDRYLESMTSQSVGLSDRRDELWARQMELRALLERERILEIDMANRIAALAEESDPAKVAERQAIETQLRLVRAQRDRWLAQRTVIEREQQAEIASAARL